MLRLKTVTITQTVRIGKNHSKTQDTQFHNFCHRKRVRGRWLWHSTFLNGNQNGQQFSISYLSKCQSISNVVNVSCSGIGSCQLDIPEGLKNVSLETYSFKNHTQVWDFNPCSFAFVIRKDKFDFSSDYLTSLHSNKTLPMVLYWAIGNETCKAAQKKANYICGANTTCIDLNPINRPGYHCECKKVYLKNPYLKDGCQSIQCTYYLQQFFQK